jgi:glycosyltransferase involved in cell wall biosynthesis
MTPHAPGPAMPDGRPSIVVLSSLFPSPAQPQAGIFIRERMFRVGAHLPLAVVSPQPWFPGQAVIRLFRRHFRPPAPRHEVQAGIEVFRPRFLSLPGLLKRLDGPMMALGAFPTLRRLGRAGRVDLIDAHFAYPDGYAAARVGRWLGVPVTITMRGTETRHAQDRVLRPKVIDALRGAGRVFAVSSSLRQLALTLGIDAGKVRVVGNGVDADRFRPVDRAMARSALGLPPDAKVVVTVGGLVERKGFHRVIACMPELMRTTPQLHYLVVGAPGPEGDFSRQIRALVDELQLGERVHFLGGLPPGQVAQALSAADVFVLATRNEGWANVLLEAMACGLPVVATDVGGNAEVVCSPELGIVVPFDDHAALTSALGRALQHPWDRGAIRRHAERNDWQERVDALLEEFRTLTSQASHSGGRGAHAG